MILVLLYRFIESQESLLGYQLCKKLVKEVLNIGSIRIYILMTGHVSNETNEDVRMYTCRIYSSRDLDTLLHKVEDDQIGKNAVLYTLATKD